MGNTKKPKGNNGDTKTHSSNGKKNKNIKRGNWKKGLKATFFILLILMLITGVALAGVGLAMIKTAPH